METKQAAMRRVVTGHAQDGKAIILFDDQVPSKVSRPDTGIVAHWVWTTDQTPADITVTTDTSNVRRGLTPPVGGTIFRVVDFPPTSLEVAAMDHAKVAEGLGLEMEVGMRYPPNHPLMHFTETIDYAIVLQGQIDMQLDDSTVTLGPGDLIVQQATNHAWINRGTEICRIAFILISSKPL